MYSAKWSVSKDSLRRQNWSRRMRDSVRACVQQRISLMQKSKVFLSLPIESRKRVVDVTTEGNATPFTSTVHCYKSPHPSICTVIIESMTIAT